MVQRVVYTKQYCMHVSRHFSILVLITVSIDKILPSHLDSQTSIPVNPYLGNKISYTLFCIQLLQMYALYFYSWRPDQCNT